MDLTPEMASFRSKILCQTITLIIWGGASFIFALFNDLTSLIIGVIVALFTILTGTIGLIARNKLSPRGLGRYYICLLILLVLSCFGLVLYAIFLPLAGVNLVVYFIGLALTLLYILFLVWSFLTAKRCRTYLETNAASSNPQPVANYQPPPYYR